MIKSKEESPGDYDENGYREPKWVELLTELYVDLVSMPDKLEPCIDDPAMEWHRPSISYCGSTHLVGNAITPLGLMIRKHMSSCAEYFLSTRHGNVHDVCCRRSLRPYTPIEWAFYCFSANNCLQIWLDTLWNAGLCARDIPTELYEKNIRSVNQVRTFREMEDAMIAMTWCCIQAEGMWTDISVITTAHIRAAGYDEWNIENACVERKRWKRELGEEEGVQDK
jgi:hypothetical protein